MHPRILSWRERLFDKLENYSFELATAWSLVFFGIRALATGLTTAPGSVQQLPFYLAVIYCCLAVVGGFSVIFGVFFKNRFYWVYGVEIFGLWVSASAWASYIVGYSMGDITGKSTLLILGLSALVVGNVLRARAVQKRSNAIMSSLRQSQQDQPEEKDVK